jgi:hypothetical protein
MLSMLSWTDPMSLETAPVEKFDSKLDFEDLTFACSAS